MQGGINNAGLFGASQREARSKLDQMAGIKRPNGILASSPELMRAAAGPAMMQPPPQQPMPMPTNMPVVQPALQPMPMPTTVAPMAPAPAPRSLNPMAPTQGTIGFNEGGAIEDGMLFVDEMNPAMMDPRIARRDARDARGVARDQERAMQQDARRLERDTRNAARDQERAAQDQRLAGIRSLNQDRRDANRQAGQLKSDARNRARISSRIGSMENALNNYGSADEFYQGRLENQRTGYGSTLPDSYFADPANRYNTFLNSAEGEAQAKQIYNQMPQELDRLRSVYDRLPNLPMNTTVASSSMNPMAQNSTRQRPVIKLNEGGEPLKGYSDMGARLAEKAKASVAAGGSPVVDITRTATKFMEDLDKETGGAVTEKYGSLEAAEAEADKRMDNIQAAVETKDATAIADAAVAAAGEEVTDAAKMDFAENVFGLEDVNDINEINRRIANVVVGSAVGKGPEEFAKAVVLGLNVLKQTAAARAEAKADAAGGGFLDTEQGKAAVELYIERIKNNEDPVEVERMMNEQLGNNIGTVVRVAIAGGTGGAAPTAEPTIPLEARRGLVEDALKQQPQNRKVILEQAQADGVNIEGL